MLKGKQLNKLVWHIGKNYLYLLGLDLNDVKNYYVNNLSSSSAKYMKTPSVIITYNDMLTTGGHNLSSKISRVKSMTNYKQSGYVPEDYERPAETSPAKETSPDVAPTTQKPVPTTAKSPTGTGTPTKPTTSNPTSVASKPATAKSTTASTATNKPSVRPRSEVISTTPRVQRGF